MSRERAYSETILAAGAADANSPWRELTGFSSYSWTIRLTVTAATLQGTIKIHGTNNAPPDTTIANEPLLVNGTLLSPADAAMAHAAGVITINNPSIGTHTIVLTFPAFPQFVMAEWDYTTGGGTVDLQVRTSGW